MERGVLEEQQICYYVWAPAPVLLPGEVPIIEEDRNERVERENEAMLQVIQSLEAIQRECDYLWQGEPFALEPIALKRKRNQKEEQQQSCSYVLHGKQMVGDTDADVWFTVYLLTEMTRRCRGAVFGVRDQEGELLLVETAMDLPRWIHPPRGDGVAEPTKRGLLFRGLVVYGELRLIPREVLPLNAEGASFEESSLDLMDSAILFVRRNDMLQVTFSDSAFRKKLASYPAAAEEASTHWVCCQLPSRAAHCLRRAPWLVPRAADAFYNRDPSALEIAARFAYMGGSKSSTHENRDLDLVYMRVRFTRCAYAQLALQNAVRSPHYPGSLSEDDDASSSETSDYKLGMKLTVGLEMLANNVSIYEDKGQHALAGSEEEAPLGFPLVDNEDWRKFADGLERSGYYTSVPGDDHFWDERDEVRLSYWKRAMDVDPEEFETYDLDTDWMVAPCLTTRRLCYEPSHALEFPQTRKGMLEDMQSDWLEISTQEVDAAIEERERELKRLKDEGTVKSGNLDQDLEDLVKRMNSFISIESDMEKATNQKYDDFLRNVSSQTKMGMDFGEIGGGEAGFSFEVNSFMDEVTRAVGADLVELETRFKVEDDNGTSDEEDDLSDDDGSDSEEEAFYEEVIETIDNTMPTEEEEEDKRAEGKEGGAGEGGGALAQDVKAPPPPLTRQPLHFGESSDSDDDSEIDSDPEDEEEEEEEDVYYNGGVRPLDVVRREVEEFDREYAQALNEEMASHPALVGSFVREGAAPAAFEEEVSGEGEEEKGGEGENKNSRTLAPVDVDMNLVTNLVEAVMAEEGLAGPASTMMKALGIDLKPTK